MNCWWFIHHRKSLSNTIYTYIYLATPRTKFHFSNFSRGLYACVCVTCLCAAAVNNREKLRRMKHFFLLLFFPVGGGQHHHHLHHHPLQQQHSSVSAVSVGAATVSVGPGPVVPGPVRAVSSHSGVGGVGNSTSGSSLCVGCGSPIQDQYILRVAPDLEWHASCLKCVECGIFLDENCTCFVRDGKTFCRRDYVRYQ